MNTETTHLEISAGRTVEITDEIIQMIKSGSPIGVGISGGKDSNAVAFAIQEVLDKFGHTGPRVLIHADLGIVEWKDSLPACRRLADFIGWELMVVEREKGGMMERWEQRWHDNWNRYQELSTVRLILPWSNAKFRFCTSELKVGPITSNLSSRFPDSTILSITGIRREEGASGTSEGGRKNAPTAKPEPRLTNKTRGTSGLTWNPIAHWTEEDVWEYHKEKRYTPHEAYISFEARRVSCVICIFSQVEDMLRALADERNYPAYFRMVDLENESTFSFKQNLWLSDVRPDILTAEQRELAALAKERARKRELAEARIPKHLEYVKGWPLFIPSYEEAALIAEVRRDVAGAIQKPVLCTNPDDVIERYEFLMAEKERREGKTKPIRIPLAVQGSLLI